jgi:hypothetical protein
MMDSSTYTLDAVQVEKAVQALQKAAETLRPSASEERLYRVLGICVRVALAAFAGLLVLGSLCGLVARASGTEATLFYVLAILTFICGLLFFFAAVGALIFLLLNQSVVRQAFRQWRLLKKLGIKEVVSLSAWKLQRRGHRWARLAGAVITACGILTLVVGLLGLIIMIVISTYKEIEGGRALAITGFIIYGPFFAFGVTVLIWQFVQRSRERWTIVADANLLRSAIESLQTKAGAGQAVAIPAAVVEHAAQIERVSIARERSDAVVASTATTDHGYGIVVAHDVSTQKRLLDPQQRVAVEDLFENLSSNPRPAGAESTPEGLLSVRTPEGDVELKYSVDEGVKRVHIVALTAHNHG